MNLGCGNNIESSFYKNKLMKCGKTIIEETTQYCQKCIKEGVLK